MDFNKRRLLLKAFLMPQLVCNRTKNNKLNRLHEICLHLISNDKKSYSDELLEIDSSVSLFTIEILDPLPLKCIKYIMAFYQLSCMKCSH